MLELLRSVYEDRIFSPSPLVVLPPKEEEEVTMSHRVNDGSFAPSTGASWWRRQHLISVTKSLKKEEERLFTFYLLGQAPKIVAGTSTRKVEVKAGVKAKVAHKEYFFRVVKHRNHYDLNYCRSLVTQAQLDSLRKHPCIPNAIFMSSLGRNVLPREAHEDLDKILFPLIMLKCGMRLLFAPFVRQLLSELSLHPLQVSLSL